MTCVRMPIKHALIFQRKVTMNKLLKMPEVRTKTGLSKSHLYALAQNGEFPKPVKLSERSSAWVESEVDGWIEERIAERDLEVA
jgi:prophage regulatory protein